MTFCKTVLSTILLAVVAWPLVTRAGDVPAMAATPATRRAPNRLPDYGRTADSFVVVATILDIDESRQGCRGEGCLPLPVISLDVVHSFGPSLPKTLVAQVYLPETPYAERDPVRIGERVLVTLRIESPPRQRTCGRLSNCDVDAKEAAFVQEMFRKMLWPSGR